MDDDMKIHLPENVYDAALNRIRRVYDEFPHVTANCSGGKDSTVTVFLAMIVARERGLLPLDVAFMDQEVEWEGTVKYMRLLAQHPDIRMWWYQVPMRISNAWSDDDDTLYAWRPGANWMRPKEPDTIHSMPFSEDYYNDELLPAILDHRYNGEPAVSLGGIRTEESPARLRGLTSLATYKDITWGRVETKKKSQYAFYPIYDWTFRDVWKFIHDHDLPYNEVYDKYHQIGAPSTDMRVSNLNHAQANRSIRYVRELEPETWDLLTRRLGGTHVVEHAYQTGKAHLELPYMFGSWREYRDYLLDNLILDTEKHKRMSSNHAVQDRRYVGAQLIELYRAQIAGILLNDYQGLMAQQYMVAQSPRLSGEMAATAKRRQQKERSDD